MGLVISEFAILQNELQSLPLPCICGDSKESKDDAKDIENEEKQNIIDSVGIDDDESNYMRDPHNKKTEETVVNMIIDDIWEIMDVIFMTYNPEPTINKQKEQKPYLENTLDSYTKKAYHQTFKNIQKYRQFSRQNQYQSVKVMDYTSITRYKMNRIPFYDGDDYGVISGEYESKEVCKYEWKIESDSLLECDDRSRHNNYPNVVNDEECLLHLQYITMGQISSTYYKTFNNVKNGNERWCFNDNCDNIDNEECTLIAFHSFGQHYTFPYEYKAEYDQYQRRNEERIAVLRSTRYINDVTYLRKYAVRSGYIKYGALAYFDVNFNVICIQTYDGTDGRARFCVKPRSNSNNDRWNEAKWIWRISVIIASHFSEWIAKCRFIEMNSYIYCIHSYLKSNHCIRRLFEAFIYGTISANDHFTKLMAKNGIYHRSTGFEYKSFCDLLSDSMKSYKFKVLKKKFGIKCVASTDFESFWQIIYKFVSSYFNIYYGENNDDYIDSDYCLKQFYDNLLNKLKIDKQFRYKRFNIIMLITHYICMVSVYNKHLNEAISFDGLFKSKLFYPKKRNLLQNYAAFAVRKNDNHLAQNDILSFSEYILIILNNGAKENKFNLKKCANIMLKDDDYSKVIRLLNKTHQELITLQQQIQHKNKFKRKIPYNACCIDFLQSSASL